MKVETIDPSRTEWVPGQQYVFHFKKRLKLGALDRSATDAMVARLRNDRRLRVDSIASDATSLVVRVTAVQTASPVIVIVYAIIGIAIVYGLLLTLSRVEKIISAGTLELGKDIKIPVLAIAGAVAALVFVFRA